MQAYLPVENYIKKQEENYGVGLLISTSEQKAQSLTSRKKNVASVNQWLEVVAPNDFFFLNMDKMLKDHSQFIIEGLKNEEFILTLFINEARKILLTDTNKESYKKNMEELILVKHEKLLEMTGFELIQFVNSRCKNHDMAKSSALLYRANIKGSLVPNQDETDYLIFNPHKDLTDVKLKKAIL